MTIRTGVRAQRAQAGAGTDGAHVIELDDGSTAEGHEILLAVGRDLGLENLGLEHYGLDPSRRDGVPHDGRLRVADGLWMVGDAAGPELHTHQGHYQGELAVRMALGEAIEPDYRALPRATYTDPEAASVGLTLDRAREAGFDVFELVADFAKTSKGYSVEAEFGHVTIVVDRGSGQLVGAVAWPCPMPPPPSTNASWRSRRGCRSAPWPRRSTPSRRRRAFSTASSPMRAASWNAREAWSRASGVAPPEVLVAQQIA